MLRRFWLWFWAGGAATGGTVCGTLLVAPAVTGTLALESPAAGTLLVAPVVTGTLVFEEC